MHNGIWVFCEIGRAGINGAVYELLGAAARLNEAANAGVSAVLLGSNAGRFAAELCACGADEVILVEDESLAMPDELRFANELSALIQRGAPSIVLVGATAFGRSLAPRVAARLGAGLTADCTALDIDPETGLLLQTRPAFGGNLLATIVCPKARPQMASVRPKVFPRPEPDFSRAVRLLREKPVAEPSPIRVLEVIEGAANINLADFDVLISVGQGIGGAKNIALAERLAHRLGGTLAASRPMIDAGLLPYARQVGQTGKAVAPKLYIALGISGAIQHMAGVSADTLVAVNTDPDAPIFERADFGLVMDCREFLEAALERGGQ